MKSIYCTDFGDHVIEPQVAERLNATKRGQPDRRYRTAKRDTRYFSKIKAHVFHNWQAGAPVRFAA